MAYVTSNSSQSNKAIELAKQHGFDYESARKKFVVICASTIRKNIPYTREDIENTIRNIQQRMIEPNYLLQVAECGGEIILVYETKTMGRRKVI